MALTQERLKQLLDYDPETGLFSRKMPISRRNPHPRPSQPVGWLDAKGYVRIGIGKKIYMAHRLAWLWITGAWPTDQVDHRDLDKANNKWANLRAATNADNQHNVPARASRSGLKGAHWLACQKCWQSRITSNGERRFLGNFPTPEEAHAAYCAAAHKLNGEFARVA